MTVARAEAARRTGFRFPLLAVCTATAAGIGASLFPWEWVLAAGAALLFAVPVVLGDRFPSRVLPLAILLAGVLAAPALSGLATPTLSLVLGAGLLFLVVFTLPWIAVFLLLAAIPFHVILYYFLHNRILLEVGGFTFWKETAIAGLFLRGLSARMREGNWRRVLPRLEPFEWILVAILLIGFVETVLRPDPAVSIRGFSASLSPLLVYFAVRWLPPLRVFPERALEAILGLFALIGAFALVQVFFLGQRFVEASGYLGTRSFVLPTLGVQRAISIFLDPLPLAFTMLLSSLVALAQLDRPRVTGPGKTWPILFALPMIAALTLSFTRAAWLGLALGAGILVWLAESRVRLIGVVAVSALLLAPLAPKIVQWTDSGARLADDSAELHVAALKRSLTIVANNPFGLGMGRAGEVSVRTLGERGIINESWYLQTGTELGVAGLILFIALVPVLGLSLARIAGRGALAEEDPRVRVLAAGALSAWMGLGVVATVHHVWAERAVAIPFWALVGFVELMAQQRKAVAA